MKKRKTPFTEPQGGDAELKAREVFVEELNMAYGRIFAGKNTGKRDVRLEHAGASWLMRFAQLDPSTLSSGGLEDHRYEVECFERLDPVSLRLSAEYFLDRSRSPLKKNSAYPADFLPSPKEITELRKWVLFALMEIRREGLFALNLNSFMLILWDQDIKRPKEKDRWETKLLDTTPNDSFKYVAFHLLARAPDRIKLCPECKTIFWATKKLDQKYCKKYCQNKVAMRLHRPPTGRKRGRPPGSTEKQRAKKPRKP